MSFKKLVAPVPRDRRLKPIYELLDIGNNRKALFDVERVLQKTPKCSLALAVKALALIRLNRDVDARNILEQVMSTAEEDGIIVGETTQILLTCYKELRQPQMICAVLEALCSKVKSEDLIVQYFMSLVRVQDHRKMYQTALNLYKTFHNPAYFSWSIASLFLHYDNFIGPFDYETSLSFQLAERMIDRYLAEKEVENEEIKEQWRLLDLYLHLMMRHSTNWNKILRIFKTKGYPPQELSSWSWDKDHEHYCLAMKQAGFKLELLKHLQNLFMEHKEYTLLKQIIDMFMFGSTDETTSSLACEFINGLRKSHPSFVVAMGSLYFTMHEDNKRYTEVKRKEQIEEDLKMLIEFGMDKTNFFPEAVELFKLEDDTSQRNLLDLMKTHAINEKIEEVDFKPLTNTEIIKDINYEFARREMMAKKYDFHQRINQANTCFGKYLNLKRAREEREKALLSKDEDTTKEVDYLDQYVLIAASILLSEHYKLGKKVNEVEDEDGLCDAFESMSVNLLNTVDQKTVINGADGLLQIAICLMEYCLVSSPFNCTLRFMLGNAYSRSGAILKMLKVVQEINVRNVQLDSLGYLIFPLVLSSGTYSQALIMLKQADLMYVTYENDSMEFVIAAYDHCSFKEAQDFYVFRDAILQSTQFGLTLVERRLHELILCTQSSCCLGKISELVGQQLSLSEIMKITCYDNRDLTVMQNLFDDEVDWSEFREVTASVNVNWFKVRLCCLIVIVKMVNTIMNKTEGDFDSDDGKLLIASDLEKDVHMWEGFCTKWKNMEKKESLETTYFGVYPPRHAHYFQLSIPDYLVEQVKYVIKHLKEKSDDTATTVVNFLIGLQQLMGEQASKLVKTGYNKFTAYLNEPKSKIIEEFIQCLAWTTEFFALTKIIFTVAVAIAKDVQGQQQGKRDSKSKGKKGKFTKEICDAVSNILGGFQEFKKLLDEFTQFLKTRQLYTWSNNKFTDADGCDFTSTNFLFESFPTTYNDMQKNVRDSHLHQVTEMSQLVESIVQFVSNMI